MNRIRSCHTLKGRLFAAMIPAMGRILPPIMLCLVLLVSCATAADFQQCIEPSYSDAKVSYLGPEGTYTQEACQLFFGRQGEYIPYATVSDAVRALVDGETDYAVIPQENTIGGAVIDYVDTLIAQTEVSVVGEVELPINQNLLALPGTGLGEIKTVYSHIQGITQGRQWLEENLPWADVVEVSSTAQGARMVFETQDGSWAAIASAACADVYNLEILASAIQNNSSNVTRFYVLSLEPAGTCASDRLAFIASGSAENLPALLSILEKRGMTLIAIHDRPLKTVLGEYNYVLECSGCDYDDYQRLAEAGLFSLRFLGCFPAI